MWKEDLLGREAALRVETVPDIASSDKPFCEYRTLELGFLESNCTLSNSVLSLGCTDHIVPKQLAALRYTEWEQVDP